MKIFISFFVLATCLWAKEIAYTDEVVSLYLNKDDTKVTGRLLPTNAFEILKSDKDRVLIKLDGYVNPKSPSVIYFNDSQRIIVAAFSKNTKLNFLQKTAGKNGKWDKVSLEVWADKKDFAKDNKKMLSYAKDLFATIAEFVTLYTPKKNLQLMLGQQFFALWQIERGLTKKTDG